MSATEQAADGRTRRAARKRERRREMVLDTALRVFSDKGYHQTRVSDIIEAASIARGTFYLYFDSKNAIFHELLDRVLARIEENVLGVDVGDDAPPLREQLLGSVRRVLGVFHESPELTALLLREAVGIDEEVDRKLSDFYSELHRWLAYSLDNGQRLGLIRPMDTEMVAWCILGSVKQLLGLALERGLEGHLDQDHLAGVLLDFHLQGILASP